MGVSNENKSWRMSPVTPKFDKVVFSLFLNFSNDLNKPLHIIGIGFCVYLINIPWSHNYFFQFKEITPKKNNWKREDFRVSAAYAEKTTLLTVKEEPNFEVGNSKKHLETDMNIDQKDINIDEN